MIRLIWIILLTEILSYTTIPGYFDNRHVLSGYITPENHLLIFSSNNSENNSLYKYEMDSNSIKYTKRYQLELKPFPENNSEIINDFYININYISLTSINIIIFNEKYLSSFIYKVDSRYSHISMEEIDSNELAIFYNSKNSTLYNNTVQIAKIDIKNKKLNFTNKYSINGINKTANINCVKSSNNNIICGLIESGGIILSYFSFDYYLILLKNNSVIDKIKVNINYGDKVERTIYGLYKYNFIKFIALNDEKILYCHYKYIYSSMFGEGISCGLAQVKNNSHIEILIKSEFIFKNMAQPNYLGRNIFSGIKFNKNEVILSCVEFNKYDSRNITKLTISNNNTFIKKYKYLYYGKYAKQNLHNYIQLLKNNDNDLIFLIIYKEIGEFEELSYGHCDDYKESLYNGEQSRLNIHIDSGLFKDKDNDIIFISKEKYINSLFYGNEEEIIKNGTIYKANKIYFHLSTKDYDEIKRIGKYNIYFRNTLNEKESETCLINLTFRECDKECDICTSSECYDRNWNVIDRILKKTKKYAKITSTIIFISFFSIIISVIVAFIVGLKKKNNSENINPNNNDNSAINNENYNNIQEDISLIDS